MKKYFFSAALVFAAVAGAYCYNQKSESEMSDIAKANVKALAGSIVIIDCEGTQDVCVTVSDGKKDSTYPGKITGVHQE